MQQVKTIGLIPARGGSKELARKNIRQLCGQPLIAYSIKAALESKFLDHVVVSTDDREIAEIAKKCGAQTPFVRPPEYSGDETPAVDVINHALQELENLHDVAIGSIVYLQPTSPLRTCVHIDEAVRLFDAAGADTVVSVVPVPHKYRPGSIFEIDANKRVRWTNGDPILRRQDKAKVYARNGPAVLIVSRDTINKGRLYGDLTIAMEMPLEDSIDIDTELDLMLAECAMKKREQLLT